MSTHIIIPDSHAEPTHNNDRFDWLGRFIYAIRPDVVIDIGDSASMDSLCTYDKGKQGYNNRRYTDDINAYTDAMERLWHPYKRNKKKLPRREKRRGNHEHRINIASSYAGVMEGTFSIDDLCENAFNDNVLEFMEGGEPIDGVTYNHVCPTPVMSKPLASVSLARAIIKQEHKSYTVGHTHFRDFHEERGIYSLVVGCYFDQYHSFAGPANENYWRGIVVCRGVEDGRYDHQWISLKTIKELFT
tara:strand:+ start:12027 stop:12761 length:735 start_codon:yes stop_codon:yes gene_type:complete